MSKRTFIQHFNLTALVVGISTAATLTACGGGSDSSETSTTTPQPAPKISILSSKAEHVSGGDALFEIENPNKAQGALKISLNGVDVESPTQETADGRARVLLSGLKVGPNEVAATIGGGQAAKLTVTNHPITGPILAGPLLSPFECRTEDAGLGVALDANCTATRKISYYYRSTGNTWVALTDPTGPRPADVATTTTNTGKTVPYIVRVDSGTINRAIYRIAILDNPSASSLDAAKWTPGEGWNQKLAVYFDGGAGAKYNQGSSNERDVLDHTFLSRGFAYTISTELANRRRGNNVLQGETLMMLKEFFIERYGVPKWVVGTGTSGGGIQQYVLTQMFPGLLNGLIPGRPFADGTTVNITDCALLERFFAAADPAVWTDAKRYAVEGFTKGTCRAWASAYTPVYQAANQAVCDLRDTTKVYHPIYNIGGARCTPQDMRVNIYGRDPATGFARKPNDNVGVQYGLLGLKSGTLTVDEFLLVNEQAGGNDVDGNFIANRNVGDEIAIQASYAGGLVNVFGGGLGTVPIMNIRNYADAGGDVHSYDRDFTIRARLEKALGRSDHHVAWIHPRNVDMTAQALDTMNHWLDDIVADPAPLTTDKVVLHKPSEAVDACFTADGTKIVERMGSVGQCSTLYPVHSETRLQAGAPITNDIMKCSLKMINFTDYSPAVFNASQQARMRAVFPTGVCDYGKPGVGQVAMKGTYLKY